MTKKTISQEGFDANLATDAFHRWATHYYKCKHDFKPPREFSPVPYFLLCRAVELEIKSRHLKVKKQNEVKGEYGHNLVKAYKDLPKGNEVLNDDELAVLECANTIYADKGFEYFDPEDTLTGYSTYPKLEELEEVAIKLIGNVA